MVKIGSVIADLFLIWTNVARTNVTLTVSIIYFKMVQGIYLYSLVKIVSVTAETFLIWTNVARTNVAWTNVTMTLGICSR